MRYRVDNVPAPWRPFWLAWSWLVGLGLWILGNLLNLTCRVRIEGRPPSAPIGDGPFIYSLWHQYWFLWFATFVRSHRRHAWMQHADVYMKPVHVVLRLMGIRILLGSGGEQGRRAASELVGLLWDGWSITISPDGPSGSVRVLKKGVLHIALQSGVPVQPVRFEASRCVRLRSWDRKLAPLPFARITVVFDEPVVVTEENFDAAGEILTQRMGGDVEA
jgi:lysophospholipid acyltransferase (LPLAT)-like uncharacterized protein